MNGSAASCIAALASGPLQIDSKPASRQSVSTVSRASSSPHQKLPGGVLAAATWSKSAAKLMLNAFAVGPPVTDLTYSALESKPSGGCGPPQRLVASIAVLPSSPMTDES